MKCLQRQQQLPATTTSLNHANSECTLLNQKPISLSVCVYMCVCATYTYMCECVLIGKLLQLMNFSNIFNACPPVGMSKTQATHTTHTTHIHTHTHIQTHTYIQLPVKWMRMRMDAERDSVRMTIVARLQNTRTSKWLKLIEFCTLVFMRPTNLPAAKFMNHDSVLPPPLFPCPFAFHPPFFLLPRTSQTIEINGICKNCSNLL